MLGVLALRETEDDVFTCHVIKYMFSCGRYGNKASYILKKEKILKCDNLDIDNSAGEISVIWYCNYF